MQKKAKLVITVTMTLVLLLGLIQAPIMAASQQQEQQEPQMEMVLEYESRYDFEETTRRFEENVKEAGWSIVQVFDYKEILADRGFEIDNIQIFAVCSGQHSAAILELDHERIVSPLMPCTISIYEKSDGNTYIAQLNSGEVAKPFGGVIAETMATVAEETHEMIRDLILPQQLNRGRQNTAPGWANNGRPLDNPAAAEALEKNFPHLFMEEAAMEMEMILENKSLYDFDETVDRLKENVAYAGWSVVGEFDYQEILGERGYEIENIKILAVCSGQHSAAILQHDDARMVSPLMPCRIAVYEKSEGNTYIAQLNSGEIAQPFGGIIAETMMLVAEETSAIVQDLIQE